ncbi:cupin domain-containing protein [Geitlerinema splendidum]|nr:cupin domain-containing protein [Geitlerinema splendidum]
MIDGNILQKIPAALPDEVFDTIVSSENIKIERIISKGHCSPPGFWYDQDQSEWVLLVKGEAKLSLEHETVLLKPGDYVNIKPHIKHRVEWTTPEEETIWIAIFY